MSEPPLEVRDEAFRIAKVWGCLCRPTVTSWEQDPVGNVLRVTLRHQTGCHYRPMKFFEPEPEIDLDSIADNAQKMKRKRQSANRKYARRGDQE